MEQTASHHVLALSANKGKTTMQPDLALVIEDEVALAIMYERVLRDVGFGVLCAYDGLSGLELLQEHTPRLVFLDMLLPLVNGLKLLEYIAGETRFQGTYVVVASSAKEYEQYIGMVRSGEFVLKPIMPGHIRAIALRCLQP